MRQTVAVFVLAALTFGASPVVGLEIRSNESNDGVLLQDEEFRAEDFGSESNSSRDGGNTNVEARHPCTYNGLMLECDIPEPGAGGGTTFTPGMAREAVANIPLPGLALNVQPNGETLVNVPTIFWVEPEEFSTTIELLGHEIEVEATPQSFTWVHGDGTAQTTDAPGKPYPDADITHRYWQPAQLDARVDTTYTVRYSIDGGGWDDLGETLTAAGPSTAVDVHEAAPVLSSPNRSD